MNTLGIQVQTLPQTGSYVVNVTGSLDMKTAMDLEQKCNSLLDRREEVLVLDFSKVDYINSQGLAVLLQLQKILSPKGGGIMVTGLNDRVEKVFVTTGVHKVVALYPSVDEALAQDPLFHKR